MTNPDVSTTEEPLEPTPDQLEAGWCLDCGEEFRYDDVGGYNPPCECGEHCRSCHQAQEREEELWSDDDDEADFSRSPVPE